MRAGGLLRVSPEDRQRKGAGEKGQGGVVAGAVGNAEKRTSHHRGVSSAVSTSSDLMAGPSRGMFDTVPT